MFEKYFCFLWRELDEKIDAALWEIVSTYCNTDSAGGQMFCYIWTELGSMFSSLFPVYMLS